MGKEAWKKEREAWMGRSVRDASARAGSLLVGGDEHKQECVIHDIL